ncbi:hypothetical protein BRC81_09395 [Halobacteriales archaeon QS_1_68_20]|nr:MAG: hypothetical protein BRC81_09395 [Halobacteriales archaeon QS_1_68_20]
MTDFEGLADGWEVWSEEATGRTVLVYRPDVFDSGEFPSACLPTLYLTHGPPERRRPRGEASADERWHATLYLEPEVAFDEHPVHESREDAVEAALDMARRFDRGELDPREPYQVPRERYLDRLDELLGRA